ncbi:MAG: serine protease [Alteromonadaceae bacterium]|jgi:serine protease
MTNNTRLMNLQITMKKTAAIAGVSALSLLISANSVAITDANNKDNNTEALNGMNKVITGSKEQRQFYKLNVPAGAKDLKIAMTGGNGDADLFVKFGATPTTSNYECRPYRNGNEETCDIRLVQEGEYHVMINSLADYTDVNLVATYTLNGTGGELSIAK